MLSGARPEIMYQDIRRRAQLVDYLATPLGLEIDRERALVAVAGQKERIHSVAAEAEMTHQVAAGRLDFNYVRTLVGQHHRRDRTRNHRRQIQDPHAIQRPGQTFIWVHSQALRAAKFRASAPW